MKLIHFEYSNKILRFAVKSVVEKAFCCNYFRITGLLKSTNVEVFFIERRSALWVSTRCGNSENETVQD